MRCSFDQFGDQLLSMDVLEQAKVLSSVKRNKLRSGENIWMNDQESICKYQAHFSTLFARNAFYQAGSHIVTAPTVEQNITCPIT